MNAISRAQEMIARNRGNPDAAILATLIQTLQEEGAFELGALYRLSIDEFEVAMALLEDWRLQRYYLGHGRLSPATAAH